MRRLTSLSIPRRREPSKDRAIGLLCHLPRLNPATSIISLYHQIRNHRRWKPPKRMAKIGWRKLKLPKSPSIIWWHVIIHMVQKWKYLPYLTFNWRLELHHSRVCFQQSETDGRGCFLSAATADVNEPEGCRRVPAGSRGLPRVRVRGLTCVPRGHTNSHQPPARDSGRNLNDCSRFNTLGWWLSPRFKPVNIQHLRKTPSNFRSVLRTGASIRRMIR